VLPGAWSVVAGLAFPAVFVVACAACKGRSAETTGGATTAGEAAVAPAADAVSAAPSAPEGAIEPPVGPEAGGGSGPSETAADAPPPDLSGDGGAAGSPGGDAAAPADGESFARPTTVEAGSFSDEEAAVVGGSVRALTADLYARLAARPGNIAFSPASIAVALGMTSGGARAETAEEMNGVLHLGDDPDRTRNLLGRLQRLLPRGGDAAPVEIAVANRLFGERTYTFQQAFLDWVAAEYAAPLEPVDFRNAFEPSRGRINAWVSEQTRGRIPVILPEGSLNDLTRLVLVNAIHFLGKWELEFPVRATTDRPFTVASGEEVPVPTMEVIGSFGLMRFDGAAVLELPYRGRELSMLVVLPPEGTAPREWATADNLAALGAISRGNVQVRLPRFTIDPSEPSRLDDHLRALGMPRAFDAQRAQFEGIGDPENPDEKLYIFAVFHRAFVKVDEEGTEAAASTAVVMAARGGRPTGPPLFWANRPFLFLLRENATGLILFAGRVDDPRAR
jgi:serpin B